MSRPPKKTFSTINIASYYGAFKMALDPRYVDGKGINWTVRVWVAPLGRKYGLPWDTVASSLLRAIEILDDRERQMLRVRLMLTETKAWEYNAAVKALRNHGLVSGTPANGDEGDEPVEGESHWNPHQRS